MTVNTPKGRVQLNNVATLKAKRGVNVTFIYDIDDHKYIGADNRIHYKPYVRSNRAYYTK